MFWRWGEGVSRGVPLARTSRGGMPPSLEGGMAHARGTGQDAFGTLRKPPHPSLRSSALLPCLQL
jgi:hypothetical protein